MDASGGSQGPRGQPGVDVWMFLGVSGTLGPACGCILPALHFWQVRALDRVGNFHKSQQEKGQGRARAQPGAPVLKPSSFHGTPASERPQ